MNTITLVVVKVSTGFFYRTNARGQKGLNWIANFNLPVGVRNCVHAINLGQGFVDRLPVGCIVEATIWQEHKGKPREFKGIFNMQADQIRWWAAANGYYQAKSGAWWLAVPTILWKVTRLPEVEKVTQQTLF